MVADQTSRPAARHGIRINLGCGANPIAGFTNVDALEGPGVDVVAELRDGLPFPDESADLIYASHVLEHFPTETVPVLLAEWKRVLRTGGRLLVAVPDLDAIAALMVENRGWFTPPHNPWLGAIYGGQKDEYDFHQTGFTEPWLTALLAGAGFGAIQRVAWFKEIGASDLSRADLPFGRNISLNLRAIAGGAPPSPELLRAGLLELGFDVFDTALTRAFRVSTRLRSKLMDRRRRALERANRP